MAIVSRVVSGLRRCRPRSHLHAALLVVAAGLVVFTLVGLIALWPSGREISSPLGGVAATESAEVTSVSGECRNIPQAAPGEAPATTAPTCRRVHATVTSGPEEGIRAEFDVLEDIAIGPGDTIRVTPLNLPPDAVVGGVPGC